LRAGAGDFAKFCDLAFIVSAVFFVLLPVVLLCEFFALAGVLSIFFPVGSADVFALDSAGVTVSFFEVAGFEIVVRLFALPDTGTA
jgi:hypothetical protein